MGKRKSKRALKSKRSVWIQRDGTPIRIKDMDDGRLANTLAMLRRVHYRHISDLYRILSDSACEIHTRWSVKIAAKRATQVDSHHPRYADLLAEFNSRRTDGKA